MFSRVLLLAARNLRPEMGIFSQVRLDFLAMNPDFML
jgi:hypothetical protein